MAKKYIDSAGIGRVITKLKALINGKANSNHTHPAQTTVSGNAGSATKLATARKISVGTAVTSTATSFDGSADIAIPVTGIKEAYLSWGGRNLQGDVAPIDAAMCDEMSANRLAFMPPSDIVIEYSTNGGSTWTDYGASDTLKTGLVTTSCGFSIGKNTSSKATLNDILRITLTATSGKLYFKWRKMLIYCNTNGAKGCKVTLEQQKCGGTTFTKIADYGISGWGGWNSIPINNAFGGSDSQTSQIRKLRLTFSIAELDSSYSSILQITKLRAYGETMWNSTNNLAQLGQIYSFDTNKDVTFPAKVSASSFAGALTGNAGTATKLTSSAGSATQPVYFSDGKPVACTNTLAKSVPADAKFTDTTYSAMTAATSSAAGKAGLVPAPAAGKQTSFLRGDGTWVVPTNTTYGAAGTSLGLVKSGGDVTIASGVITVNDNSHNHTIDNVDGLQTALDGKANSSHGTHVSYSTTAPKAAGTASAGSAATVARSDHVHPLQTTVSGNAGSATKPNMQKLADNTDLNTITTPGWYYCSANATVAGFTNCPCSVAFVMEVYTHAGTYQRIVEYKTSSAKVFWRNYYNNTWGAWYREYTTADKPTPADIGAAAASHGTHVSFSTDVPNANGTAAVGTATTVARSDHVHPLQTTVSGNAGSATKLATARTIDGVSFNGSANITHYGTCSTAAATAAKTVALTGFTLATGARVLVKFTVTNTAANPTLNVNGTGAKSIKYRGAAISAGYLAANRVYEFVYDGTNYELVGDVNTNTTYAVATDTKDGLMSKDDKAKLDGIDDSISAKMPIAGGTFTGVTKAQDNTSYTTYQLRNMALSTTAATPTGNGALLGVYS